METTIIDTQSDLLWNMSDPHSAPACISQPHLEDKFCVGQNDMRQWTSALARTLEGAASIEEDFDNYFTGQWVPNMVGDILGPTPAACDPNLETEYGMVGFRRRIDNIAIAMSNALRTGNLTSPLSIVRGSEWHSEQYIAVDFDWLVPPGAVYLAITVFLFATIFKSRTMEVPLWKTSPLVLLHSVEQNNGMQTLKQVEKESRRTKFLAWEGLTAFTAAPLDQDEVVDNEDYLDADEDSDAARRAALEYASKQDGAQTAYKPAMW
ncbi:hypothetical protein ACEQ8H_002019 [Pleosporales sp. CAS-2024a]